MRAAEDEPSLERLTGGDLPMSASHYTIEQVMKAERVSWTPPRGPGEAEYYFDGIHFWRQWVAGARRLAYPNEPPARGWRHRDDCNCALCREAAG
jgi:hypothetical protein